MEKSDIDLNEISRLVPYITHLILFINDNLCYQLAHSIGDKSRAEIYVMVNMLKYLEDVNCKHVIKMGGRYRLLEDFTYPNITDDDNIVSKLTPSNISWSKLSSADTIMYSIPKKLIKEYVEKFNNYVLFHDVEHTLYKLFENKIKDVKNQYIIGTSAGGVNVKQ